MEDFLDAAKNKLGESVENVAALAAKAGEVGQEALGVLAEAASADVESYGEGMMPPPEPETLAGLLDALVEKDAKVSARDAHKSVTKKDAFKDLSVGKVKKALAAAKKAGGGVSRSGRVAFGNRSRFGRGQRASIQANRFITSRTRGAIVESSMQFAKPRECN